MRGMTPPSEDVGLGQHLVAQAVLFLFKCGDANLDAFAEEARECVVENGVDAIGVERADGVVFPLVDVFVPDGDAEWVGHSPFLLAYGTPPACAGTRCLLLSARHGRSRRVSLSRCPGAWW